MRDTRIIVVLSVAAALLMIGVGMIVAVLPQRIHDATGSLESVGLVASVFAVTYVLTQLPAGLLADRFGVKPFLVAGCGFCAVAGLLLYAADGASEILFARAVQGIGEAPVWALGPALLSLAYSRTRGMAIGVYNAAIHVGLTVGPVAGLLAQQFGGARTPFLAFAILALAGGGLLLVFLPASAAGAGRRTGGGSGGLRLIVLLKDGRVRTLLAGIAVGGASYGTFLSVLPVSVALEKMVTPAAVSLLFVLFYAAIGLSQLVAGVLSDRYGRRVFLTAGPVCAAIGIAVFPAVPGLWSYVPLALASLGIGIFGIVSIVELNLRVTDDLMAAVSGAYYLAWGSGYALGPVAVGALETWLPVSGYGLLVAVLLLQTAAILRR
ncbi:MFS transporter [Nisaea sediminum]|uniref:MFS transporter n=1 Tax=Nisaea sediminum TaxID=2775867 RepID=UPI001867A0BD|nr:MFS transporter [Nisaea sediminum]